MLAPRRSESAESNDERLLATDEVRNTASEQKESPECQGVGRDDPLTVGVGDVQSRLGVWQGNVDNRCIQHDHQLRNRNHNEGAPTARIGIQGVVHGDLFRGNYNTLMVQCANYSNAESSTLERPCASATGP